MFQIFLKYTRMKTNHVAVVFEALASGIRLDIFRTLAENAPDGLVAGDISRKLGLPASNLSFHLKALLNADLIAMKKEGRFLRYRANMPLIRETVAFLTEKCCRSTAGADGNSHPASGADFIAAPKRRVW